MTITAEQLDEWEASCKQTNSGLFHRESMALIAEVRRLRKIETAASNYVQHELSGVTGGAAAVWDALIAALEATGE